VVYYNQKEGKQNKHRKGENKMFTVWMMFEAVCDYEQIFEGTLEECREYIKDFEDDDCFIVAPDEITVVE